MSIYDTLNDVDTAFVVVNLCDTLTPQARSAIKGAWAKVQAEMIALRPAHKHSLAVQGEPDTAYNLVHQQALEAMRLALSVIREGSREVDSIAAKGLREAIRVF